MRVALSAKDAAAAASALAICLLSGATSRPLEAGMPINEIWPAGCKNPMHAPIFQCRRDLIRSLRPPISVFYNGNVLAQSILWRLLSHRSLLMRGCPFKCAFIKPSEFCRGVFSGPPEMSKFPAANEKFYDRRTSTPLCYITGPPLIKDASAALHWRRGGGNSYKSVSILVNHHKATELRATAAIELSACLSPCLFVLPQAYTATVASRRHCAAHASTFAFVH